jgi:CheY-like chemotaxis protein
MNDYVAKPFRPADLTGALARAHAWLTSRRQAEPAA